MRKLLYAVGIATVLLFNTVNVKAASDVYYTNRNHIDMTEQEYNNLLALGFSEFHIDRMREDEFLENKDIEAELLSEKKQYVTITTHIVNGIKQRTYTVRTPEEYATYLQLQGQHVQFSGPSYNPNISGSFYDGMFYDTSYEHTTSISYVDDDVLRYTTSVIWDIMPDSDERYWDIMGVGIEANKIHIASSIEFYEEWTTTGNVDGYDDICAPKIQATGGSAMFELPSASLSALSQTLYFDIAKNQGVGTITSLDAVGCYAHATAYYDPTIPGGVYNSYRLTIAGYDIDNPYGGNYEEYYPATGYFIGSW